MGCCLWKATEALRSRGHPSPNTFNTPPLQLPLLPLTFSGLEEKTNSTEAWKGNRSSVEVVEVMSHALPGFPFPTHLPLTHQPRPHLAGPWGR